MADITKFPKIDKVTLEDKVTPNDGITFCDSPVP